jgi:hypothetical protein
MNTVKRILSVNVFTLQKTGFDKHIIPISKRQKGLQKIDYQKEFKQCHLVHNYVEIKFSGDKSVGKKVCVSGKKGKFSV